MSDNTCDVCGLPTMHGRHLHGEVCGGPRATNEELEALYAAMDRINLKPVDIVRQKRLTGERIRFLSELSSAKVLELTQECRDWEKRHGAKKGGA